MTTDPILELSTQVKPVSTFTVDGESYDLLGLAHLSAADEAEVTAQLSRFEQIGLRLDRAKSDEEAKKFAVELRKRRIRLIAKMTTVPEEVADKLPLEAQIKLFSAVRRELNGENASDLPADDGDATDDLG